MGETIKLTPDQLAGAKDIPPKAEGFKSPSTLEQIDASKVRIVEPSVPAMTDAQAEEVARLMNIGPTDQQLVTENLQRGKQGLPPLTAAQWGGQRVQEMRRQVIERDPFSPPDPGRGTAVVQGALQGLTGGWSDELAAAVEAPFSPKTYGQIRDEKRGVINAAREHHPVAFGLSEVAGGGVGAVANPLNRVVKGPANVALNAASGGLAGAGYSERKGWDALQDAILPAATGAVVPPGARKVIEGAPDRFERATIEQIAPATAAKERAKLVGPGGRNVLEILDIVRGDKELRKALAASKGNRAQAIVKRQIDEYEQKADAIYAAVTENGPGISREELRASLEPVKRAFAEIPDLGEQAKADLVQRMQDTIDRVMANRPTLPPKKVRELLTKMQGTGYKGDGLSETATAEAHRDASEAVRELLNGYVGRFGSEEQRKQLEAINRQIFLRVSASRGLEKRIKREASPPSVLRRLADAGTVAGGATAGAMVGGIDPVKAAIGAGVALGAKKGYEHGVVPAIRATDYRLAQLVSAAQKGSTKAQLMKLGLEYGLPVGIVRSVADIMATKQEPPGTSDTLSGFEQ